MNASERVYSMLADSDMTVAQIANKLKQQKRYHTVHHRHTDIQIR